MTKNYQPVKFEVVPRHFASTRDACDENIGGSPNRITHNSKNITAHKLVIRDNGQRWKSLAVRQ